MWSQMSISLIKQWKFLWPESLVLCLCMSDTMYKQFCDPALLILISLFDSTLSTSRALSQARTPALYTYIYASDPLPCPVYLIARRRRRRRRGPCLPRGEERSVRLCIALSLSLSDSVLLFATVRVCVCEEARLMTRYLY